MMKPKKVKVDKCFKVYPKKCTFEQLKEGMTIRGMNPHESGYYRMHILKIFKENENDPDDEAIICYKYFGKYKRGWYYAAVKFWILSMYMKWDE